MVALLPAPQPLDRFALARGEGEDAASGRDPLRLGLGVQGRHGALELAALDVALAGAQVGGVHRLVGRDAARLPGGGETGVRLHELLLACPSERKLTRESLLRGGLRFFAKLSHSFELEPKAAHDDAARNRPGPAGLEAPQAQGGPCAADESSVVAAVEERILCVDDDLHVRRVITHLVRAAGYDCEGVGDAHEARDLLDREQFSIVLCDIELPGESGLELLRELAGRSPDVAILMVTGQDAPEVADLALQLGAYGYVTKPFGENALRINIANAVYRRRLELDRRTHEETLEAIVALRTAELQETVQRLEASETELRRAYRETIHRLARAIEYHDGTTGAHVERVAEYALAIAARLGLDPERAELLRLASPLHDVGKLAVAERILSKPASLTPEERVAIELHADAGYELLTGSGNELLELAAVVAGSHHERWDGSGYPNGLAGEEIPLEGRIVAVADVFDALTSDRPYRRGFTPDVARAYIAASAGAAFDPRVVEAFLSCENA